MSSTPPPSEPHKITVDEMIEFLDGNGITPKCPTCGNEKSSIHVDKMDEEEVSQFANRVAKVDKGNVSDSSGRFLTTLLMCERCGYVRAFAASIVNDWLNARHPERR